MASDLSLLFTLKAQNQASPAIKTVQADVSKLKTSFGSDFKQMEGVANSALSSISSSLTRLTGNIPVVGTAVNGLATSLGTMAEEGTAAAGSLGALAGPAALAVVGVGALAAGVIALHKALFSLAQDAADFRGKLFDLSQQTGVSVETLSALEIAAATTGGSIEAVSASLGIFQKHLEDAQDPTSKQAALLEELGVSTENTEQALRDTLTALSRMPEGFHQTATALELFGRGGKSILAILKEMDGDLDGTISKFRDLGLIVSTEDARAADEFNDQLAMLQFQFRGLLGKEVIPAALQSLQDLSKTLKDNEQDIHTVALAVGNLATVLSVSLNVALAETAGIIRAANAPYTLFAQTLERIVIALRQLKGNIPAVPFSSISPSGGVSGSSPGALGGDLTERELNANAPRAGRTPRATRAPRAVIDRSDEEFAKRIKQITDFIREQRRELAEISVPTSKWAEAVDRLLESLKEQGVVLDASIETMLRWRAGALGASDSAQQLLRSVEDLGPALAGLTLPGLSEDQIAAAAGAAGDQAVGLPPTLASFKELTPEIIAGIDSMRDAFNALGNAIAQSVQAFVLFGTAGTSFRKFTAEVLASVAAQSAAKAVFELAEGLAMLALTYFTGNPKYAASAGAHFAAAATYGAIAGVAAGIGRGVAGGEFKKGAGGDGRGSDTSGSRGALDTIVTGRNQRSGGGLIRIQVDDSKFGKAITAHWVDDFNNGGDTREVIANDGR